MSPLPDTVRANVAVPFPTLVKGAGPITLTKTNGIWTIAFSPNVLATQSALVGALSTDFVVVYDSIAQTLFKASLTDLQTLRTLTVATLPAAAANKGVGFLVSDANATAFWTIVAGGGANTVPVRSDGANWRIG